MAEKRKKTSKTSNEERTPKTRLSAADVEHYRQLLMQKREAVFADWLQELRRTSQVTVDQDSL